MINLFAMAFREIAASAATTMDSYSTFQEARLRRKSIKLALRAEKYRQKQLKRKAKRDRKTAHL